MSPSPARLFLLQNSCPQLTQPEPMVQGKCHDNMFACHISGVLTSPLTSNQTSRCARPSTTGPTAIRRIMSVFPFSIDMCISSPVAGRPKKYRVGRTLDRDRSDLQTSHGIIKYSPEITIFLKEPLVFFEDLTELTWNQNMPHGRVRNEPWGT